MYKFYSIPNEDILQKIIGPEPSIKFSSAFDLNDPNELKFSVKIDPNHPAMRERFLLDNSSKTEADFESWASQISPNFEWYTAQQQRGGLGLMITLTCFTESYDNNLMWSHYANNHTGICVEYYPEVMTALQNIPGHLAYAPVTYSDEPPIIDAAHYRDKETIQKMIFTKQSEWSYEKESRLVRISDDDTDFAMLRQNQIKSVIVGSRATKAFVGQVMKCIAGSDIKFYYAINIGTSYRVRIQEHKEGTMYMRSFWGNKEDH